MTGLPAGHKVEIEFGTWTDVSSSVYGEAGLTTKFGRTSPFSTASAATLTVTLDNDSGAYTPGRQVLADGTSPNTLWPYIVPRRRIRVSYTISGTQYWRFFGYIQQWQPILDNNGETRRVVIQAVDRMDQLSRVTLTTPMVQEAANDSVYRRWSMGDAVGTPQAAESAGGGAPLSPGQAGTGGTLAFGAAGPGATSGTGLTFTPVDPSDGRYLTTPVTWSWPFGGAFSWTVEVWVRHPAVQAGDEAVITLEGQLVLGVNPSIGIGLNSASQPYVTDYSSLRNRSTHSTQVNDGKWHHIALVQTASPLGGFYLYVDGVAITGPGQTSAKGGPQTMYVGRQSVQYDATPNVFNGQMMGLAYYPVAMTAARVQAHYAAGFEYVGDTTGQRVQRYLTAAGLTSADWNVDTGKAVVGSYPEAGKTVVAAAQDMATTEGGGSVFYVTPDGKVRFTDRAGRQSPTLTLTVDAAADLDAGNYQPSIDSLSLVNQAVVNRDNTAGTVSTQTVTSAASVSTYGLFNQQVTSYASADPDAQHLAEWLVAYQDNPGFRLPQVTVDLMTAATAGLYPAVAATLIGSKIRVTNLDPGTAPATQIDLMVEGWSETVTTNAYKIAYDTSPGGLNPVMIWGGTTDYSRWQAWGMTVGAMTASATSMTVTTAAGLPTLTTVSARYPMNVVVDAEVMTITAAPASSASPQTVTVTRGQQGTPAATHTAGAAFNLYPTLTWAL